VNTPRRFGLALALVTSAASAAAAAAPDATDAPPPGKTPTSASQADLTTEKQDAASAPRPASTAADAPPRAPDRESGEDATYGHGMQLGIRAGVVLGYKMDFRYDRSPLCRAYDAGKPVNEQQKICGFGAPPGAEVALSFAPLDGVEPYVFARFGFAGESPTNTNALQLFGIGARLYTMSDSRLKIFIEPALAWETEDGAHSQEWAPPGLNPEYKKDMIFHVGVGPQYDFAKSFGMFLNAGVDVGVLRSMSATLIANIGLQLRVP
jgi:opacity protein-like surface antigen